MTSLPTLKVVRQQTKLIVQSIDFSSYMNAKGRVNKFLTFEIGIVWIMSRTDSNFLFHGEAVEKLRIQIETNGTYF